MRKVALIPLGLFALSLTVCMAPYRTGMIYACRENLWTSHGGKAQFEQQSEPKEWMRRQHGIQWAWLVVDRDTTGNDWSARAEPTAVLIYLTASNITATLAAIYTRKRTAPGTTGFTKS